MEEMHTMVHHIELIQSGLIIALALSVAGLICYILKLRNDALRNENKVLGEVIAAQYRGQQRLESAFKKVIISSLKALVLGRPEFELGYNLDNDHLWSICCRKTGKQILQFHVNGEYCYVYLNTPYTGMRGRFFHLSESEQVLEMVQCIISFPELIEV